jgi:hypothetical protein
MSDSLAILGLGIELSHRLEQQGFSRPDDLLGVTQSILAQAGFELDEISVVFSRLDFYLDRHCQSAYVCPMLPECADFVPVTYLECAADLIERLQALDLIYLNEIAFSSREHLRTLSLSVQDLLALERALMQFVDDYRNEWIRIV